MAVEFRIIREKMFDRRGDALTLHAFDITDGEASGEQRIFPEILEVASVERRTINIDTRAKIEMNTAGAGVAADLRSDFDAVPTRDGNRVGRQDA